MLVIQRAMLAYRALVSVCCQATIGRQVSARDISLHRNSQPHVQIVEYQLERTSAAELARRPHRHKSFCQDLAQVCSSDPDQRCSEIEYGSHSDLNSLLESNVPTPGRFSHFAR